MDTPIYDFLKNYRNSDTLRCHMPGHKGISPADGLDEMFSLDITEITGADSLFEADGIIAQSEKNMSRLYGTEETVYSAGGSTLCIQAMLALMKEEKRTVFAVRNIHRAFLNAAALLGIDIEWIMPEYTDGILSGKVSAEAVDDMLGKCASPSCVYVTSPDYTGRLADIPALAAVCRKHSARLLVDNAHGAHLHFFEESLHPIHLGADMCCDSAHKMLPALTGAAMLHTSSPEYRGRLKQAMSMFASTSPSYLIMLSLDLCTKYIAEDIRRDTAENIFRLDRLREHFSGRIVFADSEPFHITVRADRSGFSGKSFAAALRRYGAEYEYADDSTVILLMSPSCRSSHFSRLVWTMDKALGDMELHAPVIDSISLELPERAMSVREAFFSPSEEIPVSQAEGRICASVKVPCPPAVPIAASGEIINRQCINIFKRYGISSVLVVK